MKQSLRDFVKSKVEGQHHATDEVCRYVEAAEKDLLIGRKGKPKGVFMLLGPTGVGKTETVKNICIYYKCNYSVLDMFNYDTLNGEFEFRRDMEDRLKDSNVRFYLFDEFEKALNISKLYLSMFDEARFTANSGESIDVSHCYFLLTSNIGSDRVIHMVHSDYHTVKEVIEQDLEAKVKPEILNRVNLKCVYDKLHPQVQIKIAEAKIEAAIEEYRTDKDVHLKVSKDAREIIKRRGIDTKYGARPLERTIMDLLGDALNEFSESHIRPLHGLIQPKNNKQLEFIPS